MNGTAQLFRRIVCLLRGGHRVWPYDPNWPLMTCENCGWRMR